MKIVSERESFIKGIQTISSAITSKMGSLPVLQNFLIETEKDGINIIATDLEIAIKHFIKTDIKTEGSITLPMKKFNEIIQNFDEEFFTLNSEDNSKVILTSGKAKIKLGGTPKSEYSLIPDVDEKDSFKINAYDLLDMIEKTIYSTSTEDERYFLNGLLWENKNGVFSIVATDGRRLAHSWRKGLGIKKDFRVIIPTKILNELTKFVKSNIKDKKEDIKISLSSNQVAFLYDKTIFISKFIEGNFPAYEQIIPNKIDFSVKINANKLLSATKRAAICSNDRNSSVKYILKKNVMVINSSSQNAELEDEIDINYKGEEFQINYNPKFILDILKNIKYEDVVFEFVGQSKPSIIKTEEDKNFLYIVMPLRQ